MSKKVSTKPENIAPQKQGDFVFGKQNYQLVIAGVAVVILGFILMSGTTDILDFRKITLAPIMVLAGFGIVTAGILRKPKDQ